MPKLNQIVAVEGGLKSRTAVEITNIYHEFQKKNALYEGLSRTYQAKDEDGDKFPSEGTMVQRTVEKQLPQLAASYTKLIDATLTKDVANTQATGRVNLGGQVLLEAPVPFLLFLKKQVDDLRTELSKIPVLDSSVLWHEDPDVGGHRTDPISTTRTRKVKEVLVKYPATDKHPAQTETYDVDVVVGTWSLTRFSGAVSQSRKDELLSRCNELSDAVKMAVEEANSLDVEQVKIGEAIFEYLFAR